MIIMSLNISASRLKCCFQVFYNLRNMISDERKRLLVTAYILPHITYATPFLINCTSKTKSILDITYKKAVKILFRLPHRFPTKQLTKKTGCTSIEIIFHSLIYAFKIFRNISPLIISSDFRRTLRNNFILCHQKDQMSLRNNLCLLWNNLSCEQKTITLKNSNIFCDIPLSATWYFCFVFLFVFW